MPVHIKVELHLGQLEMNLKFKGKSYILSCVASLVEAMGVNGNSQGEHGDGEDQSVKDHKQSCHVCSGHLAGGCCWRSTTKRKLDNEVSNHKGKCCLFFLYCLLNKALCVQLNISSFLLKRLPVG